MKILVAYYSWSGTTKHLAQKIHRELPSSDLLEIKVPTNTFSSDMYETADIYEKQKKTHHLPSVINMPKNINDYDLILLGSPTWDWGVTSPVMKFMENIQNFKGKVAPFYTSVGNSQRFMEFFHNCCGQLQIIDNFDDAHDNFANWLQKIKSEKQ